MSDLSPLCAPKRKLPKASTVSAHASVMGGQRRRLLAIFENARPTFSELDGQGGVPFPPHERHVGSQGLLRAFANRTPARRSAIQPSNVSMFNGTPNLFPRCVHPHAAWIAHRSASS